MDIQNLSSTYATTMITDLAGLALSASTELNWTNNLSQGKTNPAANIAFNIGPNGFFENPADWTSQRESPGKIQQAISELNDHRTVPRRR